MARDFAKNGLQLYYDGKNNTSPTTHSTDTRVWYDLSGHARHGSLYTRNSVTENPWGNNFLNFKDVNNGGVSAGYWPYNVFKANGEMTCEIFFESAEDYDTAEQSIISNFCPKEKHEGGFIIYTATRGSNSGNIVITISASDGSSTTFTMPMEINTKILITLVVKQEMMYLYKNGVLINTKYCVGGYRLNANHYLFIGASNNDSNLPEISDTTTRISPRKTGKIYSVRLYNRALNENEVYYNYMAELDHLNESENSEYPDIPNVEPDIGDIIVPIEDGQVSRISIDGQEVYNVKDTKSRTTKLDKYEDDTAYAVINFMNGFQVDLATIKYDIVNNTVIFK